MLRKDDNQAPGAILKEPDRLVQAIQTGIQTAGFRGEPTYGIVPAADQAKGDNLVVLKFDGGDAGGFQTASQKAMRGVQALVTQLGFEPGKVEMVRGVNAESHYTGGRIVYGVNSEAPLAIDALYSAPKVENGKWDSEPTSSWIPTLAIHVPTQFTSELRALESGLKSLGFKQGDDIAAAAGVHMDNRQLADA